jgi:hypothetical protein
MTPQEAADRLVLTERNITPQRIRKFVKMCQRIGVNLDDAIACLPPQFQDQVRQAV